MEPGPSGVKTVKTVEKSSSSPKTKDFLDLNDDTIMAILEYLPLEDLNRMSLICKRIYHLSDDIYRREHLEHLTVVVSKDLKLRIHENYFPYRYSSDVPNLHINCRVTMNLFQFIRANCCRKLKRIEFNNEFDGANAELIKDQLSTIEYMCLGADLGLGMSEEFDIYENLLQFCKNLKHLEIRFDDDFKNMNWLTKIYPKLTRLDLPYFRLANGELLKQFMKQNAQLETFTCSGRLINSMLPNLPKFKRLIIQNYDRSLLNDLKTFCDDGTIEWLEINTNICHVLDSVAKLKSLRAIGALYIQEEDHTKLAILQQMTQLWELHLDYAGDDALIKVASTLPELLKIIVDSRYLNASMDSIKTFETLMMFAKNTKKLKTLELRRTTGRLTFDQLLEIDSVRSMVPGATKMDIIFNMSWIYEKDPYEDGNFGDLKFIRVRVIC